MTVPKSDTSAELAAEGSSALAGQPARRMTRRAPRPTTRTLLTRVVARMVIGEKVQLVTNRESESSFVRADPAQLEQVITNLAINARNAMPDGGSLTIATENVVVDEELAGAHPEARVGPHVMLSVRETGTGMSEAVKARLFEPFYSTNAPGQGTGLGPSTVHSIVRRSEGLHLHGERGGVGRGTTFRIYLPRVLRFVRND